MLPGIIPVGVSTPAFAYKEGYTGSLASGGTATISLSTPATPYRWLMISAGGGQSTTNSLAVIEIVINGVPVSEIYTASNQDSGGTGSATTVHVPVRLYEGSSFTLNLSNTIGFAMNYTVGVFEIPVLTLANVSSGGGYGSSPASFTIPVFAGGIAMVSQFGQGGSGTWSDMTYTNATKIPVASSAQESLAYYYATVSGTLPVTASNNAGFNRVYVASNWTPA